MSRQYNPNTTTNDAVLLGGTYATIAALTVAVPPSSVPTNSIGYTSDVGQVINNGAAWVANGADSVWRIPGNVDPTGVADSTTGLQTWLTAGAAGDPLYLPVGTYKISDTLVASGNSLILQGAGALTTKLNQVTANKTGIRFNITGDGLATPGGYAADFSVIGPAANPTDFKSGVLYDNCRGFDLLRVDVGNFDIGFDFINNCFNSSLYHPSCHRFSSVNIGMNLRGVEGAQFQSGNDICIYDAILSNKLGNVVVGPNSGGFNFFGGQFGTSGLAADRDDLASIMLGVQYDSVLQSGTGTLTTGACTANFNGLSLEGLNRTWFIQTYNEVTAGFYNMGYTPSATGVNAALGILKATSFNNSMLDFGGVQTIQSGGILKTAICSLAGGGSAGMIREGPWQQGSLTVNSVGVGTRTMQSLVSQSGSLSSGIGHARRSSLPIIQLGNMWLRGSTTAGGVLQFSVDGGSTWNAV